MAEFARRVTLEVSIDGHDVASVFSVCLLDFTFTDNASGKADDLQISLRNSDGKFAGSWRPKKGMEVVASIICHDWENQGEDLKLPCGSFTIDEVELTGPPDKIQIKAVSASLSGGLRDTKKTRAWENISLKTLAGQIAEENGMELMYIGSQGCEPAAQRSEAIAASIASEFPSGTGRAGGDIYFERQDQRNESDISFLTRLAGDFGMNCKAHDGKLVLFDSEEAEGADAVIEIPKTGGMYSPKSYSFKMSSSGTDYDRAEVAYTDPKTGKTQTAEAKSVKKSAKKKAAEKVLTVNQRVENPDQAQKLARAKLHKENQKEQTASLECMGNPALVAGRNVKLTGFEEFSGAWCIKSATHKLGGNGGYSVSMELTSPAPTEGGKTESFTRERGEIFQTPGYETDNRNVSTKEEIENFDSLAALVNRTGTDLDKLILCLPEIALAEADRCWLKNDRKGWLYLSQLLAKWLSIKEGQKNISPFWVDFDWVISYRRAHTEYNDFLLPIGDPYVFSPQGKEKLCEKARKYGRRDGTFTLIDNDWPQWESRYFNFHRVGPFALWPDGLMAAMQGFTFRALANGNISGNGEVKVGKLAFFVHDVFNFEPPKSIFMPDTLGFWSCVHKDFALLPADSSYFEITNQKMKDFGKKYKAGADFLVLSDPHAVEDFEAIKYDCAL